MIDRIDILGGLLLMGLLVLALLAQWFPGDAAPIGTPNESEIPELVIARTDASGEQSWLQRSPFTEQHEAFARPAPPAPPEPIAPPIQVELVGVSRSAGELTATITLDGVERSAVVGEETPVGTVVDVGLDYIVFDDGGERRVGLFD